MLLVELGLKDARNPKRIDILVRVAVERLLTDSCATLFEEGRDVVLVRRQRVARDVAPAEVLKEVFERVLHGLLSGLLGPPKPCEGRKADYVCQPLSGPPSRPLQPCRA